MTDMNPDVQPAPWQATTATVHCDRLGSYVRLVVLRDWKSKCVDNDRCKQSSPEGRKRGAGKTAGPSQKDCGGTQCDLLIEYRAKLIGEESFSRTKEESFRS